MYLGDPTGMPLGDPTGMHLGDPIGMYLGNPVTQRYIGYPIGKSIFSRRLCIKVNKV